MDGLESRHLAQGKQCQHQWVTLFPSLGLCELMRVPCVVVPNVAGGLVIKHPDEWETTIGNGDIHQPLQHGRTGNGVVGTDAIDRQDCVLGMAQHIFDLGTSTSPPKQNNSRSTSLIPVLGHLTSRLAPLKPGNNEAPPILLSFQYRAESKEHLPNPPHCQLNGPKKLQMISRLPIFFYT